MVKVEFSKLTKRNFQKIEPLYLNYFNKEENASWTPETVNRKFKQLFLREDLIAYELVVEKVFIGFFIGQLMQFDDGLVFELLEILVLKDYQSKGYGSLLLEKAIKEAKQAGAFMIQLTSAVDKEHYHFYNVKHSFSDASNNVWKSKMI